MDGTWTCPVCQEVFPGPIVAFSFPSDRRWVFNLSAVLHLVGTHGWKPPEDFCQDVIGGDAELIKEGIATNHLSLPRTLIGIQQSRGKLPDRFDHFLIELGRVAKYS